jgi:hypothetical protein
VTDQVWNSLAQNGPWAMAAAYLLNQVLKAWASDRAFIVKLTEKFQASLDELKLSVDNNTHATNRNAELTAKLLDELTHVRPQQASR